MKCSRAVLRSGDLSDGAVIVSMDEVNLESVEIKQGQRIALCVCLMVVTIPFLTFLMDSEGEYVAHRTLLGVVLSSGVAAAVYHGSLIARWFAVCVAVLFAILITPALVQKYDLYAGREPELAHLIWTLFVSYAVAYGLMAPSSVQCFFRERGFYFYRSSETRGEIGSREA